MSGPSVFISYSHKDEEWKERLVTHLGVLAQEGILDLWEDRRIEGVFREIQNTGRNLGRLLAKTVWGLRTRIVAKMTSHLLRRILRTDFAINVLTFQTAF